MRLRNSDAPILHFQIPPEYSQTLTVNELIFWHKELSKALPEYRVIPIYAKFNK